MNKKKITNLEFSTINYFVTRAFLIGITFNGLISVMKQDSFIIPLLSIISSIILVFIVNGFMNFEPSLNFSQKLNKLFNKKMSLLILIICIIFTYFMCTLNFLCLNSFIQSQFLTKTPILAISILFGLATLYILSKGINTISRTSLILFYIGLVLLIISSLGLVQTINFDNLKPLFTSSPINYIEGLNIFYAFNITPMLLLTSIPKDKIDKPKIKKYLIISSILSAVTIFILVFQTIAVFGYELSSLYEYAAFHVLKHVSLFGLNSRIESILVMQLLFDVFMYNILAIYFIGDNIKSSFKFKNSNIIYFCVCFLVIIGTLFLSKYNIYLDNLMKSIIPITITLFSIFIIIIISIKKTKSNKQ